ncbi:hypothetical protein N0A02_06720 [Paraburkholderia acidicola]|uniref:Uncharacterized protein n=1 Tax=Paraburkholderia acidicola TaxID=1912599 RepID=A0ABV1LIT8_9BURK
MIGQFISLFAHFPACCSCVISLVERVLGNPSDLLFVGGLPIEQQAFTNHTMTHDVMTTTQTTLLDAIAEGRATLAAMDEDIKYTRGLGDIQAAEGMQILRDGFAQYQARLEAPQPVVVHEQTWPNQEPNFSTDGASASRQTVES